MKQLFKRAKIGVVVLALPFLGAACSQASDAGVFRSEDAGSSWAHTVFVAQQNRKVITIARVDIQDLEVDPSNDATVYAATKENGLYKTTTAGEQWFQLPVPAQRIRDVVVDPSNSNIVYAAQNNNIFKSIDAGESWDIVFTDAQQASIIRLAIDPLHPSLVYAGTIIGSVVASSDEGLSWKKIYQVDEPIVFLASDTRTSGLLYVLELDEGLHISRDFGATWTPVFAGEFKQLYPFAGQPKTMALDPNNGGNMYIGTSKGIIRSTDGGTTWSELNTLIAANAKENESIRNILVQPGDSLTIYFSIGRLIHTSSDGGNTWKTLENFPSSGTIMSMKLRPTQPQVLYAGVEKVEKQRFGFIKPK